MPHHCRSCVQRIYVFTEILLLHMPKKKKNTKTLVEDNLLLIQTKANCKENHKEMPKFSFRLTIMPFHQ